MRSSCKTRHDAAACCWSPWSFRSMELTRPVDLQHDLRLPLVVCTDNIEADAKSNLVNALVAVCVVAAASA